MRGINDSKVNITQNIRVENNGNLHIDRILNFRDKIEAEEFFKNNKFVKISLEALPIIANLSKVGSNLLFNIINNLAGETIGKNNNAMRFKINTDRAFVNKHSKDLGISERSIRSAVEELKLTKFLMPILDNSYMPIRGAYILNINFVNDLNFEQWYNAIRSLNDDYKVCINYKIKYE